MTASLHPLPDRERGQIELAAGAGEALTIGPLVIDRLALAAGDAIDDGELGRWQRRRTRLASVRARVDAAALTAALAARRAALTTIGVGELTVTTDDVIAVTARIADGLASADVSFQVGLSASGRMLRAIIGAIRVHGHLPTPAPLVVQRLIDAVLGDLGDAPRDGRGDPEPIARAGLCEWVIDVAGLATWRLLPPAGWRLPALDQVRVVGLALAGGAVTIELGATGEPPPAPPTVQAWAVAHAAMASADELLRQGLLEDALRGYRALLAAAGPEQPALLERIAAITSARPSAFVEGRELARQALGRWPEFAAAHAALASIALAEGDTREAAARLATVAQLGSRHGDRAGALAAALAAARLYRVIDPTAATGLYQRALTLAPGLVEAEDALIERLTDERRWRELVALHDARGGA